MARKPEIQYIHQFYVPGSEARKAAPVYTPRRARTTLPEVKPKEQIRIQLDPVALGALAVAVVMLVLMAVGVAQYLSACEEHKTMERYITHLQDENAKLEHDYQSGYNLTDVENQAQSIGLIPASQAETIRITVNVPQPEPEPTPWEEFLWFLDGLLE